MDKIFPTHNFMASVYCRLPSIPLAFKEVCPDSDAWRFGVRSIPIFVYDMLFELRLHAALSESYRRFSWAGLET